MPHAPRVPVDPKDHDTMSGSDVPLATSSSPIHAPKASIDADTFDSDSDLDVLSEHEDLERTFELKDLAGTAEPSGVQGPAFRHGYRNANMDDEKPPQPRGSKKARFLLYTPEEERAVLRKLDRRLVLFMALLYMLSFLDRSSKSCGSTIRPTLMWIYRYRECKNSWVVTRSAAELFSI